jgi:hypothetical protein
MSVADDQTLCSPDNSATGVAATMAAPETADGETAVIAAADAVTPLAWSLEEEVASEDVVPYPDTDAVEAPPGDTGWGWAVVVLAVMGASLAVVVSVSMLRGAHEASQAMTTTTPTRGSLTEITEAPPTPTIDSMPGPLVCPPGTKPGFERNDPPPDDGNFHRDCVAAETAPVTVTAPPVTVTAPPAVTTPTPIDSMPGPAPTTTGVAAFTTGIAEHPDSEPMPPMADALIDGHEVCNRMSVGQSRRDIENTLVAEHGLDFGSAAWIWIQASRKLCPNY